jgi:hypothetical protein
MPPPPALSRLTQAGALLAAPLPAQPARAAPRPARLVYVRGPGAEQCPDEAALRAAVTSRLGEDPFRGAAARTIEARVRRTAKGLEGAVDLRDASGAIAGARRLSAGKDDCDELVASMALAISIAIDPESQLRPPPAPASPPPAPASPPPSPAAPPPQPAPPPPAASPPDAPIAAPLPATLLPPVRTDRPRLRLRAGVLAAFGAVPGTTAGVALDAGVRWPAFSVTLGAQGDVPASREAAVGGSVRAFVIVADVAPCGHLGPAFLCAVGAIGVLRGSGADVAQPRSDATLFASMGLRLGAEIPLAARFSLAPYVEAAAPFTRTSLQLRGSDVWTVPVVQGAVGLAGVAHFP